MQCLVRLQASSPAGRSPALVENHLTLLTTDSNTILRAKSALTDTVKQEQFIVEWRDSITIIGNEMGVDYGHLKVTIS